MPTMSRLEANRAAASAMLAARPVLTAVRPAREVIAALEQDHVLLHSGPPIAWENMLDIQKGAVVGAMLYEGWAQSAAEAESKSAGGHVRFIPCDDVGAVGSFSGVTSPSMPVAVAHNSAGKEVAFARLWEPHILFGAFTPETIRGLQWLERVFAPTLDQAVHAAGGVDMRALIAEALHMGDDCSSRLAAGSSIFLRRLVRRILTSDYSSDNAIETLRWLAANDVAFLPFVLASAKVIALAGSNVAGSSVITALCSNGYQAGVKLSGAGSRWFNGPAPTVESPLQPGVDPADVAPLVGDGAIVEVVGLGGGALAAAPNAPANVHGSMQAAIALSKATLRCAVSRNPAWTMPALNFAGAAAGLDARAIVRSGILPPIAATAPTRRAGGGPAARGIAYPPLVALQAAVAALDA